jgi:hypothetical protein
MSDDRKWYRQWWIWAAIVFALMIVFFPVLC